MYFSDYMDTCTTKLEFKLEHCSLPITVDILDAEYFEPFMSQVLTYEQYNALFQMAVRLINYHYSDVE